MKLRRRGRIVLGICGLLFLAGSAVPSPATAQELGELPELPPTPLDPVIAALGPTLGFVCGQVQTVLELVPTLDGLTGLPDDLRLSTLLVPALSPVTGLCGLVPIPETVTTCAASGTALPGVGNVIDQITATTELIAAMFPGVELPLDVAGSLSSLITCTTYVPGSALPPEDLPAEGEDLPAGEESGFDDGGFISGDPGSFVDSGELPSFADGGTPPAVVDAPTDSILPIGISAPKYMIVWLLPLVLCAGVVAAARSMTRDLRKGPR